MVYDRTLTKEDVHEVLRLLNEVTQDDRWSSTTFLRALHKRLTGLCDNFSSKIEALDKAEHEPHWMQPSLHATQREVFVALYSSHGGVLQSWERILMNLPKQIVSRPIYANEEDVKALIRTKSQPTNDAYVAMIVDEANILPANDKGPIDKLGKPLLTLKDRTIQMRNVLRFVHMNTVYRFEAGHLILA